VKPLAVDSDARQIAETIAMNRNTVNRYPAAIRKRIARCCAVLSYSQTFRPRGRLARIRDAPAGTTKKRTLPPAFLFRLSRAGES
jgi:hypothetical protein